MTWLHHGLPRAPVFDVVVHQVVCQGVSPRLRSTATLVAMDGEDGLVLVSRAHPPDSTSAVVPAARVTSLTAVLDELLTGSQGSLVAGTPEGDYFLSEHYSGAIRGVPFLFWAGYYLPGDAKLTEPGRRFVDAFGALDPRIESYRERGSEGEGGGSR